MGYSSTTHSYYEGKNIGGRRYANNNRRRNSPGQRERSSKYRHAPRAQECNEYNQEYSRCHNNAVQDYNPNYHYEHHEYDQNYEYDQQYNEQCNEQYTEQYTEQYNEYCDAPVYEEYCAADEQSCCQTCHYVQAQRAQDDYRKGKHSPSRRDNKRKERQPGQALPGRLVTPQRFVHNPYTLNVSNTIVPDYHAHEDTAQEFPKNVVLCLRWVSGKCSSNEANKPVDCPYAHPDLSEVPPGVCATYWFTGFCRFDRRDSTQLELEDESFGLHGWTHYRRLEPNFSQTVSDDSSNDDGSKKSRRRPPSICYACHHAQPVGGFPLLPGISCKTTVLEREAALALYPKWY